MKLKIAHILLLALLSGFVQAKEHPCLIIQKSEIAELRKALAEYPEWKANVDQLKQAVDLQMANGLDVPVPKDPAGGYTHSQHKANGKLLKNLGIIYQITAEEKYAAFAKELFLEYAKLYPTLGEHPIKKSYAPGKLFWQQLNEAVWLVNAIQGYDLIFEFLNENERKKIENDLLLPFADFLSVENMKVFNRIHNHGVWAVTAVGMTGIVLDNEELVLRAFYGVNKNGKPVKNKISIEEITGNETGFFAQTSQLFSPDGYYTEGPYYQRYAMTPFLTFAQSIDNNYPELKILEFRNKIFLKAIRTLIDLSDNEGKFFPINDNLKGMSLKAPSVQAAICFLYAKTHNPELLTLAKYNKFSLVNKYGLEVVKGLSNNMQKPLKRHSKLITDGTDGKSGGIAILRDSNNEFCAVFKYASHGLSHGHFDRLNLFYYNNADEVLTDYGAARFVNFKDKNGGRYLPENKTYAKQTIAHNTIVVDEKSHFNGSLKEAEKFHPELIFSDLDNAQIKIVCAAENNAYPGVGLKRTVALLDVKEFENPVLIDVYQVQSEASHQYDLPFHFDGQLISTSFNYTGNTNKIKALGETNGYQHLWQLAEGKVKDSLARITWLTNNKFYSVTTVVDSTANVILSRIGANDPNFNLRNEPAIIFRQQAKNHVFTSVIECHGSNNPNTEKVVNQHSKIKKLKSYNVDNKYQVVDITTMDNKNIKLIIRPEKVEKDIENEITIDGSTHKWLGSYKLIIN